MRTINANLTTEQAKKNVKPYVTVTVGGTDLSSYLVGYVYREQANQQMLSELWLDNTDGHFNSTNAPAQGAEVVIDRGLYVSGTGYKEDLPTLWVEQLEYAPALLKVICIDFWGRLARYRRYATYTYTADTAEDIIDWILDQVGLTWSGSITSLTLDFTITRNERLDQALRRICGKIPEYPYAGLGKVIKFKDLDSSDSSDYSFGWQSNHPVRDMRYITGAWKYNKIRVYGAFDGTSAYYEGYDEDTTQRGLVGLRELIFRDPMLSSNAECTQRAESELSYYEAAATQIEVDALPVHGLELYDMVTLVTTPWGQTSKKARVKSYIERYGPGDHQQEIRLLSPAADSHIEPAQIADPIIENDLEGQVKIGPAALDAYHTVGAVFRGTDSVTNYNLPAYLNSEVILGAGRVAEIGDAVLVYDDNTSSYRLFIKEAAGQWVYFVADGAV